MAVTLRRRWTPLGQTRHRRSCRLPAGRDRGRVRRHRAPEARGQPDSLDEGQHALLPRLPELPARGPDRLSAATGGQRAARHRRFERRRRAPRPRLAGGARHVPDLRLGRPRRSGMVVADGVYRARLTLVDESRTIVFPDQIRVDATPPKVEDVKVQNAVFSPDGDGRADRVNLAYRFSEPAYPVLYVGNSRKPRGLPQAACRSHPLVRTRRFAGGAPARARRAGPGREPRAASHLPGAHSLRRAAPPDLLRASRSPASDPRFDRRDQAARGSRRPVLQRVEEQGRRSGILGGGAAGARPLPAHGDGECAECARAGSRSRPGSLAPS